ncbi:RE1-silencing transcription factor B-like [Cimex lectularius]|uniref:C2H2-type domain-containing protein n=1 Tax=Cimex lectularius TaxID=79782 RepID=A0A8I6SKR9_CIMLE|nr:RE1-silencing transcription factor B-like [Cimex lectularius]
MRFTCPSCPYKARQKVQLKKHLAFKHNGNPANIIFLRAGFSPGFPCSDCGRVYKYKHNMVYHRKHSCGQPDRLSCMHCDYKGSAVSHLRFHLYSKHADIIAMRIKGKISL